jgi:hypothetical protein
MISTIKGASMPWAGLENKMAMKVLVKNRDTGLFLKGETLWTNKPVEARDFHSCPYAMEDVHRMGLTNAELVLSFGDPAFDINISLCDPRVPQPAGPAR